MYGFCRTHTPKGAVKRFADGPHKKISVRKCDGHCLMEWTGTLAQIFLAHSLGTPFSSELNMDRGESDVEKRENMEERERE